MNQKLRGFLMTISLGPPLKTFIKLDSWALFGIISLCCSRVAGGVFGRKYQVKRWCPGSFSKTTLWSTWRLAFGDGCLKASFFPRSHEHFQTGVCWGIFFFFWGGMFCWYILDVLDCFFGGGKPAQSRCGRGNRETWKMTSLENVDYTVDGRNPEPVEVGGLSHYFLGFIHPRWYRNSSINSISIAMIVVATGCRIA